MDTIKRSFLILLTLVVTIPFTLTTTGCQMISGLFSSQTVQIGLRVLILELIKSQPGLAQVFTVMMGEIGQIMQTQQTADESFDVLTDKLLDRYSDYLTPLQRQQLKQEFQKVYNQTVAFADPPVAGGIPLNRENLAFRKIQNNIEQALLEQGDD